MKKPIILLFAIFGLAVSVQAQCCKNAVVKPCAKQSSCDKATKSQAAVKAYYFHSERRCATCLAVEETTREVINNQFKDKVSFVAINRETDKTNPLIKKYEISGQTLILVKGEEVIDLTNQAFLLARTNPEKYKTGLKESIKPLL